MSLTGPDAGTPSKTGIATADVLTGLHAAIGILAALHHRERTGEGQRVELNLMSSMLSGLVNFGGAYALTGDVARGMGIRHPSICPYEPFPTADRLLIIAAGNDRQFQALCDCLGLARLGDDPRFATNGGRVAHREALTAALADVLRTRSAEDWFATLTGARGPLRSDQRRRAGHALRRVPRSRAHRRRRRIGPGRQPGAAVGDPGHLSSSPSGAGGGREGDLRLARRRREREH